MGPIWDPYTSKSSIKVHSGAHILNIVIINVLFTTLYEVQINIMPNESIFKSVLFSSFCTI